MNPLNSQSSQTQYFITTGGMPTLTPNSDQHLATASVAPNPVMNSHQHPSANHFIDANKFVTTSYVPVLLTNQTLITNIETQQQHQHQQPQTTQQTSPSTLINVSNSPVVAATANIPLITSNPVGGGGGGNVTYVVTSPQTQNFGTMLPGQILLTAPTTLATSGE